MYSRGFIHIVVVAIVVALFAGGTIYVAVVQKKSSLRSELPAVTRKDEVVFEGVLKKEEAISSPSIFLPPAPPLNVESKVNTLPAPSQTPGNIGKIQKARDPWNDPIVSAPINLTLPLVVADIEETGTVLSPYGIMRKSGDGGIGHGGIDFPLRKNSPVYAVASGTIIKNNLEDPGGGKTVDILIMPGKFQGDGWIFKYDHVNLMPGLKIGGNVERGQQIGTNAFVERGNNHIGLEYQIKNFTIAREKICWVDRLEPNARQQLEDAFDRIKKTPAFLQFWQTANEEGYYQYRGLLDELKYPNGPQLCYTLGTDMRIPASSGSISAPSSGKKEIYGDRIPFYQKEGVSFEYYWPMDPIAPGLSAEETEMLVHNESGKTVEISFVEVDFNLNGQNYLSPPGSWEKFISRLNWDRIEYRIFPRGAVTPPFTLAHNQKGKLHYHFSFLENPTSDKPQSAKVKINFSVDGIVYILDKVVNRPSQ